MLHFVRATQNAPHIITVSDSTRSGTLNEDNNNDIAATTAATNKLDVRMFGIVVMFDICECLNLKDNHHSLY